MTADPKAFCALCGAKVKRERTNGLCRSCDDKRIVEITCPTCRKPRDVRNGTIRYGLSGYECTKCAQKRAQNPRNYEYEYRDCSDCGNPVLVALGRKWSGRCKACLGKIKKAKYLAKLNNTVPQPIKTPLPPATTTIQVNGCTLIRRKSGRCEHYEDCKFGTWHAFFDATKDQDCCHRVGRMLWPGWECSPGSKPDLINPCDLERIHGAQIGGIPEFGFYQQII